MDEMAQIKSFYQLIDYQVQRLGNKPFILHEDQVISYADFGRFTCQAANGLRDHGAQDGDGLAVLMANCPEYYFLFFGLPRRGFYSVPVNTALRSDGLKYILEHSEVRYLVVDEDLYGKIGGFGSRIGKIEKIFVRRLTDADLPPGTLDLTELLEASSEKPDSPLNPEAMTYLMYTSGTTGFPKGVVNRNRGDNVQAVIGLVQLSLQPDDVLYTALPLFHANALVLTPTLAMAAGVPFAMDKRFSASRFWDNIRRYGATQFNAIGAMISILMKQPEKADDADNPVRIVNSAACPAHLWEPFEKRFKVKIWEAYAAVDGGGVLTINVGNAPIGSIGKPVKGEWKLVDENDNEVAQGEIGELINKLEEGSVRRVEYFKDAAESEKKARGGWIRSGDLFYADQQGNLYFVDRANDSMRRRGENISSFEVENIVEKHPDVQACAAFGVASDLGEDEVMIWVKPVKDRRLDLKDLIRHCRDHMAFFMVPRFVDVVEEIPRTGTLKIMKGEMKRQGVSDRTWDREKEMPEL